jgi:uncharacterized protein YoaH (UPF0181 family)
MSTAQISERVDALVSTGMTESEAIARAVQEANPVPPRP